MSDPLVTIREWEDEPDEGREAYDWPYPTRYVESLAQGELADRIRIALGVPGDSSVYVTERIESGGYSEYTPMDDYYMTVTVDGVEREWCGGITSLLRWLDQEAPVAEARK